MAHVMDDITIEELKAYLKAKKKGTAPSFSGITIEDLANLSQEVLAKLLILLNAAKNRQVVGDTWCYEILKPIPKEPGNPSRDQLRPLKLQELLRKCLMGILFRRVGSTAERLQLFHPMQFAFRSGKDCSLPLLALRAIIDHCMTHKIDVAILLQDITTTYDTAQYTMAKEAALRRWGLGEDFIALVMGTDRKRMTTVKTGHGLTSDILGGGGWFHDEAGFGQGGEESPLGWDCFFDIALCVLAEHGGPPLNLGPHGATQPISNLAYADDNNCVANQRSHMQVRDAAMEDFFACMGLTNAPHKEVYLEAFHDHNSRPQDTPTILTMEQNPGTISSTPLESGTTTDIIRVEHDLKGVDAKIMKALKYLGKVEGLGWDTDDIQIGQLESTILLCLQRIRYKRIDCQGRGLVLNRVLIPKIAYPLKYMTVSPQQMDQMYSPAISFTKLKDNVCEKAPCHVFNTLLGYDNLSHVVTANKVVDALRGLNDPTTGVQPILSMAIGRRARWTGSAHDPGDPINVKHAGDDHTWFGDLLMAMDHFGFCLLGTPPLSPPVADDINITDSPFGDISGSRDLIMEGCRIHDIWWKSEALAYLRNNRRSANHMAVMTSQEQKAHDAWLRHITRLTQAELNLPGPTLRNHSPSIQFTSDHWTLKMALTEMDMIGPIEMMAQNIEDHDISTLYITSDGSAIEGVPKTAMGWEAYLLGPDGKRHRMACGGHVFAADSRYASSYRAEAQGLLAGMVLATYMDLWAKGCETMSHSLDNASVVQTYNKLDDMTYNEWLQLEDFDVWWEIAYRKRTLQGNYVVTWHRGHPEKWIKDRNDWQPKDWAVWEADKFATAWMHRHPAYDNSLIQMPKYPNGPKWVVMHEGGPITGKLRQRIMRSIKGNKLQDYFHKTKKWTSEIIQAYEVRLLNKLLDTPASPNHTRHLKLVTAQLPVMVVLLKRGHAANSLCKLCGVDAEDQEHMLFSCTHPKCVKARHTAVEAIKSTMVAALPEGMAREVSSLQLLDNSGALLSYTTAKGAVTSDSIKLLLKAITGPDRKLTWRGLLPTYVATAYTRC